MRRSDGKPEVDDDVRDVMKGQALYRQARRLIPGGTQLLSKRPELFLPDQWPVYYDSAQGAHVVDADGRRFADFAHCGVGTCTLGFADPDVNQAVIEAVQSGSMSTLNPAEDVALAELLIELHPWAEMVRYARTGGEAMAVAVRIARSATGRSKLAFCGYHGWHDWYLAANLGDHSRLNGHMLPGLDPAGVVPELRGTALPFHYNRLGELEDIVDRTRGQIAAIVMEPRRDMEPEPGFLEGVQAIARSTGAVLIFDEITAGWRMTTGGIHMVMGHEPDIAVFGKAMSNGYPMAAIIGTRSVMDSAQDSFISSAYWTERLGPAAALATIRKHRRENIADRLIHAGGRLREGWQKASEAADLSVAVSGILPLGGFAFDEPNGDVLMTLFTQLMLERGFLAGSHVYTMVTHTDDLIGDYLDNAAEVFRQIAKWRIEGDLHKRLVGPVKHSGFHRLN